MHEMGLSTELLQAVLSGRKTVEARLRSSKFLVMRSGDTISFREDVWKNDRLVQSTSNQAQVVITESIYFDSFVDMLEVIDYRDALPQANSKQEALTIYRQFSTDAQEQEHGVVALRFKLVPKH